MPNYFVVRTDRKHPRFFTKELSEGRLRQGWGYRDALDLRILAARVDAGEKLAPDEPEPVNVDETNIPKV